MLPALIILALWVALLAPGVVRWLRNHKPSTSIASFHRQLRLLEHTGPKLVEPAYRLEGEDVHVTEREEHPSLPRVPRLVLLPTDATHKEPATMRYDDRYDDRYEDPFAAADGYAEEPWDEPWEPAPAYDPPTRSHRTARSPRPNDYATDPFDDDPYDHVVRVLSPERARARRTRILAGLGAAIVVSFVFGLLPGLTMLWAVTIVSVLALITYLVLMFYASNQGMYGNDTLARVTPVARTVIAPYADRYDDGWEPERVAAAR